MSKKEYMADLGRRIEELDARIRDDRQRIESGAALDKIDAAGDLAMVEKRLDETKAKLARLGAEPEGIWQNVKAEFERELDFIKASFSHWGDKHE